MSNLYPTKNDISEDSRRPVIELLNRSLADAVVLGLQAKQAHWNVKGPDFYPLHQLFDQVFEEATGWADLIAERAVQLGGRAESTLQHLAERTTLPKLDLSVSSGRDHVEAFSDSLAWFGKQAGAAISTAEQYDDIGTADLFTEVSRGLDKMLWFVEAHLHAEA